RLGGPGFDPGAARQPDAFPCRHALVPWVLSVAMLLQWAVLTSLARQWKDGTVAGALALCFAAAGAVILHAHSARLTNPALLAFGVYLLVALVAWRWPGDTGAA